MGVICPRRVAMNQWANYPNLRIRPAKPAFGRGRLQRQVRRAFMVEDGPTIVTRHRYSVWRVLKTLGAEPIGRVGPRHAILWRLPDDMWARWR